MLTIGVIMDYISGSGIGSAKRTRGWAISIAKAGSAAAALFLLGGDYAIAILHDENGNSRLDRFAGIPREGIGFSRNPRFSFGPPRFSSVQFRLDNRSEVQSIRMRYFF